MSYECRLNFSFLIQAFSELHTLISYPPEGSELRGMFKQTNKKILLT